MIIDQSPLLDRELLLLQFVAKADDLRFLFQAFFGFGKLLIDKIKAADFILPKAISAGKLHLIKDDVLLDPRAAFEEEFFFA